MVKIRKPITEHLSMIPILKELVYKDNNSLGLSKILNKDQSTINIHLNYLYEELFIKESIDTTRTYQINYNKLIEEFILFIDKELENQLEEKKIQRFSESEFYKCLWEEENEFLKILLGITIRKSNKTILNEIFDECLKILQYYKFDDINIDTNKYPRIELGRIWIVYRKENEALSKFVSFIGDIQFLNESSGLRTEIEGEINKKIENESKYSKEESYKIVEENQLKKEEEVSQLLKENESKYSD